MANKTPAECQCASPFLRSGCGGADGGLPSRWRRRDAQSGASCRIQYEAVRLETPDHRNFWQTVIEKSLKPILEIIQNSIKEWYT